MRSFDAHLLHVLKTEIPQETLYRTSEDARKRFAAEMIKDSGNPDVYNRLLNPVSVARVVRYVDWPLHRTNILEMMYMVSGEAEICVSGENIHVKEGDFFIPNQYTDYSRKALGENDIAINFIMKPQFLKEAAGTFERDTELSGFLMDSLRRDIIWNRYLHFSGLDDLHVLNLAETMISLAFPVLNEQNILCGSPVGQDLVCHLMQALLAVLSRNMDVMNEASPDDYDTLIREETKRYIRNDYKTASLQELAEILNQSESTLSRQIKKIFGCTFKDLLLESRFARAKVLLKQTNLPVSDIAEAVGYENTSFFYRRFRNLYGISPKEYRKKALESDEIL